MTKAHTHQTVVNENDLWETPPEILQEAIEMYGIHPTLDVCATDENHKLDNYFTPKDNALDKNWDQDFFMNPPYSEIYTWMEKAYSEHLKHNVTASILVFGKISVKWFHKFVYDRPSDTWLAEFKPFDKRIRFLLNGVEPRYCKDCRKRFTENITHCNICNNKIQKSSPTYDSVWIIFRKRSIK